MSLIKNYKYVFMLSIIFIIYNSLFLNKAFHIDDPFTIAIAKAVAKNYFIPPQVFFDHPILLGYYYAPIIKLFGETEIWLHMFYLPFSLLVVVSMYSLCRRFADNSLFPLIFLVCTPAFIVTSQNIMLDIPLLGFFLASLSLFIYGVDGNNYKLLVLSAISTTAAVLTKYPGLILMPLLFIYTLIHSKKYFSLFLIIPTLIFLLWNTHNIIFYKSFLFLDAALLQFKAYFINNLLSRTIALLSFLTGTSIIIIFLLPYLLRNRVNINLFLISSYIGLCIFSKGFLTEYTYLEKFVITFFLVPSLFIILLVLKISLISLFEFKQAYNKDKIFLSLWFFVFLIFTVCSNFIAARFVLFLFPPMFLLIYDQIFVDFRYPKAKVKKIFILSIFITSFLSSILAIGDYRFAGIYRDIYQYLQKLISGNRQVYFYLGDWGYDYYMMKAGYRPLTSQVLKRTMDYRHYKYRISERDQILTCDDIKEKICQRDDIILIVPREAVIPASACRGAENFLNELSKLRYNYTAIGHHAYLGNVILMNRKLNIGFYSDGHGILPFSIFFQKVIMENFDIYHLAYTE